MNYNVSKLQTEVSYIKICLNYQQYSVNDARGLQL